MTDTPRCCWARRKYLAETRNFDGTAVVIFQPAEEGGGGGKEMCDDGMMDRFGIDEVYGMHNWPGRPTGSFAIRAGHVSLPPTDQFDIIVEGKGGHAAKPHETIDTTVVASHIVLALQTIASRNADPIDADRGLGHLASRPRPRRFNVIPQKVQLKGTVRTLDACDARPGRGAVIKIWPKPPPMPSARWRAVDYQRGYPVMVNAEDETEFAAEVARKVSGNCEEAPLVMGGEDFAFMLEERPGAYILVGNGDTAMVHHPEYNFNDEAIPAGCSWYAEMVETRLPAA